MMFAVGGMLLFPAANDLLTMFVALEVLSLPLYLLCGLARRRRLLSQEAALKYFLLGAFSSGFFLYGIALVYGYAGSMGFARDRGGGRQRRPAAEALLLGGIGLIAVGLLFKVGAAPFHAWTPDVYQGAPTAVTAFMAAAHQGRRLRRAAAAVLRRLRRRPHWDWTPMIWIVAILTMVVGSVLALTQTDIKRMLAYSSIAHAGFILTGFLGVRSLAEVSRRQPDRRLRRCCSTWPPTASSTHRRRSRSSPSYATPAARRPTCPAGRARQGVAARGRGCSPSSCSRMAGIPLTSGFTGKWAVFAAALSAGAWPVVDRGGADVGGRGVLLRPGDRADVLRRPGR